MSQLVPYSQPNRNVGLLDSFRLAREDRQANAELERLTRRSAMTEVYAEHQAMHEARGAVRRHELQVGAMLLHEARVTLGADIIARSYDHIVERVGGDPGKASYLEPLMSKCAHTVTDLV